MKDHKIVLSGHVDLLLSGIYSPSTFRRSTVIDVSIAEVPTDHEWLHLRTKQRNCYRLKASQLKLVTRYSGITDHLCFCQVNGLLFPIALYPGQALEYFIPPHTVRYSRSMCTCGSTTPKAG